VLGTFERTAAELFERIKFFTVETAAQTPDIMEQYATTLHHRITITTESTLLTIMYGACW
jgi:hypothetical protein